MSLKGIILCATFGLVSGAGVLPESVSAAEGDTVMFTTSLPPTQTPFISIAWSFGTKSIITSSAGGNFTSPEYEDRITLFSTGSLELRNVSLTDTGKYSVVISPAGSAVIPGLTTLNVYEPVSNVRVTVSSSDLVEFNSSVTLSCSAHGANLTTFLWFNGSNEVTASDRVSLTDGGATLTIATVWRSDQGPFRCQVSNPVSNSTSDPAELSISYGPENVQISGPKEIQVDKTFKLNCFCDSAPTAIYTWIKNGMILAQSSEYTQEFAGSSDSGEYICRATNEITKKTVEASHTVLVTDQEVPEEPLSTGAIAGIIVASLVIVAGAAAGGFTLYKHQKSKIISNNSLEETNVYENTSTIHSFNTDDDHVYDNV